MTHGITGAYYSLDATWRRHVPTLECECGESFSELDWAEAGAAYDEHLHDNPDPETEE